MNEANWCFRLGLTFFALWVFLFNISILFIGYNYCTWTVQRFPDFLSSHCLYRVDIASYFLLIIYLVHYKIIVLNSYSFSYLTHRITMHGYAGADPGGDHGLPESYWESLNSGVVA